METKHGGWIGAGIGYLLTRVWFDELVALSPEYLEALERPVGALVGALLGAVVVALVNRSSRAEPQQQQ